MVAKDYSKWATEEGWHNSVISTPALTNEEILDLCNQAKIEFYIRPKFFLKTLKLMLKDRGEAVRVIKASKIFIPYAWKVFTKKFRKK